MNNFITNHLEKTLGDDELLIRSGKYYYPANPVYSNIQLEKKNNKYIVKNINDFIVKKQYYNPIYSKNLIDNEFIIHYKKYLIINYN